MAGVAAANAPGPAKPYLDVVEIDGCGHHLYAATSRSM